MPSLIDRVRAWNRKRIAKHRMARLPRMTPFGFAMNASDFMISGNFEPDEIAILGELLKRCDRFVNVGANSGFYCLFARKLSIPVVAIEPIAQTVAILMQNLIANGYEDDTTVLPVAVGASPTIGQMYGVGTGASFLKGWANNPESLTQLVPVVRMDDVIRPPSASERLVILIDVEGFGFQALLGATNLLSSKPSPILIVEIAPDGAGGTSSAQIQQTFDLMLSFGYIARSMTKNLEVTSSPVHGINNYMFSDTNFDVDAVISAVRQGY